MISVVHSSGPQLEVILLPRGHLAMSGDLFGFIDVKVGKWGEGFCRHLGLETCVVYSSGSYGAEENLEFTVK